MTDDLWFERLAEADDPSDEERTPASLKSKVYSALVATMAGTGPLLDLRTIRRAGGQLCVFEAAVAVLPLGPAIHSRNPCRICHARVLGERMEHAPIFWPGCPYSEFHTKTG
jgi:hypothetical protein